MASGLQITPTGIAVSATGMIVAVDGAACCCTPTSGCTDPAPCVDASCLTLRLTFKNSAPVAVFLRGTTWDLVKQNGTGVPGVGGIAVSNPCQWFLIDGDLSGTGTIVWLDLTDVKLHVKYQHFVGGGLDTDDSYEVQNSEHPDATCPTDDLITGWTITCVG